jgi:hypothetical protein
MALRPGYKNIKQEWPGSLPTISHLWVVASARRRGAGTLTAAHHGVLWSVGARVSLACVIKVCNLGVIRLAMSSRKIAQGNG